MNVLNIHIALLMVFLMRGAVYLHFRSEEPVSEENEGLYGNIHAWMHILAETSKVKISMI